MPHDIGPVLRPSLACLLRNHALEGALYEYLLCDATYSSLDILAISLWRID